MAAYANRIILTGATGYVGGTLLDHLLKSTEPSIKQLTFDLLVRSEDQAQKIRDAYGARVNPILWKGLDDIAKTADIAANYDIVINTGLGFHPPGAKAFVTGLSRRVQEGTPVPWILHISGCTNLGDRPLTEKGYPDKVWDDADGGAVYQYLKTEDERNPYLQRTTEVGVLTAAAESGVQAVSLNTPCIFGEGTGLFNKQGIILPTIMRYVVSHGHGYKLTETANFDWVHVEDLADAYVLLIRAILEREDRGVGYIPSGTEGIMFPAVGRVLQLEIMQRTLDVAFDAGVLPREDTPKEKEIRQIPLQDLANELTYGMADIAEQGWAGNKAQKGTMLKKLFGWSPSRLEEAWAQDFVDELNALKDGRRGVTMDACIGLKN
ncbi:putative NAD-dependent epimerase/dehydratase domain-containing protein [Seiridium unicorne]|uniref:NAD-dependent epimerase/dehydratase domain-containing protein n=1 Tax=Seiridium unicorne TaxID=138068 RepID=A0ABR2UI89_9PEZI